MKITKLTTDKAVLVEMGRRLALTRLQRNWTQAELALEAGVSKRTVERLEAGGAGGEGTRLSAFIRVCRTLDLLEGLEIMLPEPRPNPIAQFKLAGRARRRASGKRKPPVDLKPWSWGKS